VFVDPDNGDGGGQDHGSGWWYEGGGLYRHVNIVTANKVHVEQDGLFAYSNLTWAYNNASWKLGAAPDGVVHLKVSVHHLWVTCAPPLRDIAGLQSAAFNKLGV
jgi:hypothetical protein